MIDINNVMFIPVTVQATVADYKLKASDALKGRRATHIAVFTESDILLHGSSTPVASNGLPSISLTLNESTNSNFPRVYKFPTKALEFNNDVEGKGFMALNGNDYNWETSTVNVISTTNISNDEVLLIALIYELEN